MIIIQRCQSYRNEDVRAALMQVFEGLGGLDTVVPAGARVMLKPNLLSAKPPDKAATTHPAIVAGVLELVRSRTQRVTVGDSPALGDAVSVAQRSGIAQVCRDLDVPVVDFRDSVRIRTPEGSMFRDLEVAREVLDADVVINLPKLKTHGMMRMTAGVKNMFGCVVGERKPQWHLRAGRDGEFFATMLVELYEAIRPAVTIVDAVVAMEGQGPGSGQPRQVGLLIAGSNAHHLDWACARLIGFAPSDVPTLSVAGRRGLVREEDVRVNTPLEPLEPGFAEPRPVDPDSSMPAFLKTFLRRYVTSRPIIIRRECRRCMECLRICPAGAISNVDKQPRIDYSRCIRCYCCQEICPYNAIRVRAGLLLKLYHTVPHRPIIRLARWLRRPFAGIRRPGR